MGCRHTPGRGHARPRLFRHECLPGDEEAPDGYPVAPPHTDLQQPLRDRPRRGHVPIRAHGQAVPAAVPQGGHRHRAGSVPSRRRDPDGIPAPVRVSRRYRQGRTGGAGARREQGEEDPFRSRPAGRPVGPARARDHSHPLRCRLRRSGGRVPGGMPAPPHRCVALRRGQEIFRARRYRSEGHGKGPRRGCLPLEGRRGGVHHHPAARQEPVFDPRQDGEPQAQGGVAGAHHGGGLHQGRDPWHVHQRDLSRQERVRGDPRVREGIPALLRRRCLGARCARSGAARGDHPVTEQVFPLHPPQGRPGTQEHRPGPHAGAGQADARGLSLGRQEAARGRRVHARGEAGTVFRRLRTLIGP